MNISWWVDQVEPSHSYSESPSCCAGYLGSIFSIGWTPHARIRLPPPGRTAHTGTSPVVASLYSLFRWVAGCACWRSTRFVGALLAAPDNQTPDHPPTMASASRWAPTVAWYQQFWSWQHRCEEPAGSRVVRQWEKRTVFPRSTHAATKIPTYNTVSSMQRK